METQTPNQVKIYKLVLNPMRANTEKGNLMALAYNKQSLIDYMKQELADKPYTDKGSPSFECQGDSHNWHKTFKKGSKLEWYNPPRNIDDCNGENDSFGHGIHWELTSEENIQNFIEECENSFGFKVVPEFIKT